MNILDFVRSPDWRSVLLAMAFVAPWLALLSLRRFSWWGTWAVLLISAVLFPISIAWVQAPLQLAVRSLYGWLLPAEMLGRYALVLWAPVVFLSGLVQETAKLAVVAAILPRRADGHPSQAGLSLGAVSGAGYGGAEAFWSLNQIYAGGFAWATVQMLGPIALMGFAERFFAVVFHIAASALAAYGYATDQVWQYLGLAVALHTLTNYFVLFVQTGLISAVSAEAWVGFIASATMAAVLLTRFRSRTD